MYHGTQKAKERGAVRYCLWLVDPGKVSILGQHARPSVFRWSAEDGSPHGSNTGVPQKRCWALAVLGLGGVLLLLHIRKPGVHMGSVTL